MFVVKKKPYVRSVNIEMNVLTPTINKKDSQKLNNFVSIGKNIQ